MVVSLGIVATLVATATSPAVAGAANPATSLSPKPDYQNLCAPAGVDASRTCLALTLAAIDSARTREGLGAMRLPSDFAQLSIPEQLFVAVDVERVDRGLVPFEGLANRLDASALQGARAAALPSKPGHSYRRVDEEWIGNVDNGLDADYQWMYFDGPGSGLPHCGAKQRSGCWVDREILLDRFGGARDIVMGAGYVATSAGNHGGSSLSVAMAAAREPRSDLVYTWAQALAATRSGTLAPLAELPTDESATGIADPTRNIAPDPNYYAVCAPSGIDSSQRCINDALAAINHAHTLEGVRPMVLPTDFSELSIPEQLFVGINLERTDRGLAPFVGMTTTLDANAQKGADDANDPPADGSGYLLTDDEWAGGSVNGLDAVYGWMYQDGFNSGNLDCLKRGAPGCWGHRHGILDDFGSGNDLTMGTAFDPTGDTNRGDIGGTSMAATLAVAAAAPHSFVYTWAQALAAMPPSSS